jgi:hypothetical protein
MPITIDIRIPVVTAIADLTLPEINIRRYTDQIGIYNIVGSDNIVNITPQERGAMVLFIFTDDAADTGLVTGGNLQINTSLKWVANDTILLVCDGTSWFRASTTAVTAAIVFNQTIKDPAGVASTQRSVLKFTGAQVTVSDVGGETVVDVDVPVDIDYYQTVKNPAGTAQTQRSVIKFTGAIVTVSDVGGETVVDVTPATDTDYYQTVQDAGSDKTQRDKLNFVGAVVSDSASPSRTTIDVTPADGSITTAKLAANAVTGSITSATGSTSSNTLNNDGTTEYTDITQAFTVTSGSAMLMITVASGVLEIRPGDQTGGGRIECRLYEGSNLLRTGSVGSFQVSGREPARVEGTVGFVHLISGLSAGSHTFTLRFVNKDAVATVQAFVRGDAKASTIQIVEILR